MSMKNSIDTIGNRTRDLPTCSAVPQPTAPPRAPIANCTLEKMPCDRKIKETLRNQLVFQPGRLVVARLDWFVHWLRPMVHIRRQWLQIALVVTGNLQVARLMGHTHHVSCLCLTHYDSHSLQGVYKLSEDFAKPYFHKYWTEIHDVTTVWKRNVCSFIATLNAFDVRPTCDTADVQAISPFPPNLLKLVLCDVPDCDVDALSQFS